MKVGRLIQIIALLIVVASSAEFGGPDLLESTEALGSGRNRMEVGVRLDSDLNWTASGIFFMLKLAAPGGQVSSRQKGALIEVELQLFEFLGLVAGTPYAAVYYLAGNIKQAGSAVDEGV